MKKHVKIIVKRDCLLNSMNKLKIHKFQMDDKRIFVGIMFLFIFILPQNSFAERVVSIERTVDVNKEALLNALSDLESYPQIFPENIKSSKLLDNENTAHVEVRLEFITTDADIKFSESNYEVTIEVTSGDLKGTKLLATLTDVEDSDEKTHVFAEVQPQMTWFMSFLATFVSDENITSMLHTSLDKFVQYAKNPQSFEPIVEEEEEKFCIFGLCF